jgi:hypothetical protein
MASVFPNTLFARSAAARSLASWSCMVLATLGYAQWSVPGPIVLNAPDEAQRQVLGLGPANDESDALRLDDLRMRSATLASAVDAGAIWELALGPEGTPVVEGMVIDLIAPTTNLAGVALDVNGTGALPLVGWKGSGLDSAAITAGRPLRVVRTATHYIVLDKVRSACPAGYRTFSAASCIETAPRTATTFFEAANNCLESGARLCTFAEWTSACTLLPGFMDLVPQAEWIDHAANSDDYAKIIGVGENGYSGAGTGCDYGGLRLPTNNAPYRCCIER